MSDTDRLLAQFECETCWQFIDAGHPDRGPHHNRFVQKANGVTVGPAPLDVEPVRLRFGQEVILDTGPTWGGESRLVVGWIERTESLSVSGQFVSLGASREYVLCDGLDAPDAAAIARAYEEAGR